MRYRELFSPFHLTCEFSGAQAQDGQRKAMCPKDDEQAFAFII